MYGASDYDTTSPICKQPAGPRHFPEKLSLLYLPDEIIENVLSCLNYEEISEMRRVCSRFNHICKSLLNKGFIKVTKFHGDCQRHVKSQLPRRESERRNHPLARHSDILGAIETRLSLLCMTFMKYVDADSCCFIPGKVIDEIFRVLRYVRNSNSPPRAHELLQELRDISSMAMEHFDEKIAPELKKQMTNQLASNSRNVSHALSPMSGLPGPSFSSPQSLSPHTSNTFSVRSPSRLPSIRRSISKLERQLRITSGTALTARKGLEECRKQRAEQRKKCANLERQMLQQSRLMREQNLKITDQEKRIDELNRKILEYDQKFVDLYSELPHVREAGLGLNVVAQSNKTKSDPDGSIKRVSLDDKGSGRGGPLPGSSGARYATHHSPVVTRTRSKRKADNLTVNTKDDSNVNQTKKVKSK